MTQDTIDIKAMRQAFRAKFRGKITLDEMQEVVQAIMSRQLVLPETRVSTVEQRKELRWVVDLF
ncbi:MAG: hypothetical protein DDT22_01239 [candidate division WS2 bacterium]|nr:hypothetical protein [Candidatus Lithacetigena glycinireducens]